MATANICPSPMILSVHGSWPPVKLAPTGILRKTIDVSTWFTACSEAARGELLEIDDSLAGRTQTILNGLDPPPFEPSPLSFDPPVLLCSARVQPEKGMDLAIDAVARLRDEFPGIRLRIVGGGTCLEELEAQVARLGLGDSVEFAGWRSPEDIAGLIDEATIVLVPSRLEGFGLIALEGMLGARPVVASNVGGLPEVLGDDGGLLIEPENPEAIVRAVRSLLGDPAYAQTVAAAGRKRAQAVFPLHRCVDDYENLYRNLTTNGHAS
jgi:glycosyltransferase involved in cell wall biosynthesis